MTHSHIWNFKLCTTKTIFDTICPLYMVAMMFWFLQRHMIYSGMFLKQIFLPQQNHQKISRIFEFPLCNFQQLFKLSPSTHLPTQQSIIRSCSRTQQTNHFSRWCTVWLHFLPFRPSALMPCVSALTCSTAALHLITWLAECIIILWSLIKIEFIPLLKMISQLRLCFELFALREI